MKIILLGMPGAGKGTQAELIKVNYSIPSISTGAILRDIGNTNSDLGAKVQSYLQSGRLVPDEIIIEILVNRISEDDCSNGFLLDGFPRNIDQAKALEKANIDIDFVVFLNIEEQEIIKRMSGRRMHLKSGRSYHIDFNPPKNFNKDDLTGEDLIQREDDKPEVIKKRLEVYYKETFPLLDFYRKESNNFFEIDGSLPVEEVAKAIDRIFSS
ncbi:MAG: adenylate kinase [Pseudomonadota bacterium]|nr:adenylate kinase [Pseudomonadota bacterium]